MNRFARPVCFAMEPDVVSIFLLASFGAAGAPTLNTNYSKGICNLALNSIAFTGTTTNASPTVSSVSSFAGLYNGMTVTGTNIPGSTTISSMNPGAGTITLSANATGANTGLSAAGGQYVVTFGSQFSPFKRLDPYVRLLGISYDFDASGSQGGASTGAIAPAAPYLFLVGNSVSVSTLASLTLQCGYYTAGAFTAANPASGEALRVFFSFTRSTAV